MIRPLAIAALLLSTATASAQLHINTNENDTITGLAPPAWLDMVTSILDCSALDGVDEVCVVNDTNRELTVTCDKWTLVGNDPYKSVRGNPPSLKPFSATVIRTNEFDGYCESGVIGHPKAGHTYTAKLNGGSFTHSTVITFSAQQQ